MEYYTVYKVTNKLNGKVYIGSHKTKKLDDGYMGSGKYLKRSIEKHGIENFEKEILYVFDNPKDMFAKEGELVNEEFLAEENTYNLKVGGFGGWDYVDKNGLGQQAKGRTAMLLVIKEKYGVDDPSQIPHVKEIAQTRMQERWENEEFALLDFSTRLGVPHTEETKQRISEKAKERLEDPTKNSQYGTMWINNGIEAKKIRKDDSIPEGWSRGRIKKPKTQRFCCVCGEATETPLSRYCTQHRNELRNANLINNNALEKSLEKTRRATDKDIEGALINADMDIDTAMSQLGYKVPSFGNSRYRFIRIKEIIKIYS